MITDLNTLKSWFVTKAMPLQEQFWNWLDSFRHSSVKINMNDLDTDVIAALNAGGTVPLPGNITVQYTVQGVLNVPPGANNGDSYRVGTAPINEWTSYANQIAVYHAGTGWAYTMPKAGDYCYNSYDATTTLYTVANIWTPSLSMPILNNGNSISTGVVLGTTNDTQLDFKTNGILRGGFTNDGKFLIRNLNATSGALMLVINADGTVSAQAIPTGGGGGGTPGRGISTMVINGSGHLIVTYTDSTTDDLGNVVGAPGATGATGATGGTGATGATGANGTNGQGFNFRGAWAATTAYAAYDVVTYNGSTYECSVPFTSGATFNAANWNVWARAAGNAFTLSFNYPVRIFQDYYENATTITSVTVKDVGTLSYSLDGNTYTVVTLPLTGNISIASGSWVWWKITYATGKTNCSAYLKLQ